MSIPSNLFDRSLKALMRRVPEALYRLVRARSVPSSISTGDTSVILRELRADDVFIGEGDEGRWALYLEYQDEPDRRQVRKWLLKALALEDHLEAPVILVVLYLRKGGRASFPEGYRTAAGGLVNEHSFAVVRLWEQAERIRSGELMELAPLLVLCEDAPAERALEEERKLLREAPLPQETRNELLGLAYLVGLKYVTRAMVDAIFREEFPMLKDAGIIGEWIEEAEARGEARGEVRGHTGEARLFTLRTLRKRFGDLPRDLVVAIGSADQEWCYRLVDQALDVDSVADLRWKDTTQ